MGVTPYERGGWWRYGSVGPDWGDAFWFILPQRNAATTQIFLDALAQAYPGSFNIRLVDNAGAHAAQSLRIPETTGLLFQPPRCPELNPARRGWPDVRSKLAWQRVAYLEALEDELVARLNQYQPVTLQSLAGYPYLVQAYHAVCL